MIIFWRLVLAHLMADFLFHFNFIYKLKNTKVFAGYFVHGVVFFLSAVICCQDFLFIPWLRTPFFTLNGAQSILVLSILHAGLDKINPSETRSFKGYNLSLFLLWQAIEIMLLFIFAPFVSVPGKSFIVGDKFIFILIGVLISTYFFMVLIHLFKRDFCQGTYPIFDERFVSTLYRLSLYLLLLIPGFSGYLLGGIWAFCGAILKKPLVIDNCPYRLYGGTAITIILALIMRFFIYHL
ncbi:MAG: DUF3307 domain-containing protein [Elusimicrobiaceae bacterium]|nr:DUF3307 domain-containing protein [Elusimicrobiaceae bacterium]